MTSHAPSVSRDRASSGFRALALPTIPDQLPASDSNAHVAAGQRRRTDHPHLSVAHLDVEPRRPREVAEIEGELALAEPQPHRLAARPRQEELHGRAPLGEPPEA